MKELAFCDNKDSSSTEREEKAKHLVTKAVGCYFLLPCMKVKSQSEVAQLCPTLSSPMDCSLPGSSVHGIFQAEYWSEEPLRSTVVSTTGKCPHLSGNALFKPMLFKDQLYIFLSLHSFYD